MIQKHQVYYENWRKTAYISRDWKSVDNKALYMLTMILLWKIWENENREWSIAFVAKRRLRQTLMGPFVFQFFKRYKGQDTQTIILPISAFFLVLLMLKVFSCFLLLFYLLLCVTFYWIDTKNDTKLTKRLRVVSRAPCSDECFFYIFLLSILKGIKTYFVNILQ